MRCFTYAVKCSEDWEEKLVVGYLMYSMLVLAVFFIWFLFFMAMRKGPDSKRDLAGYVLIGPMHAYLKNRGYNLTHRELFGWGIVLLLMLLVPWITRYLEP